MQPPKHQKPESDQEATQRSPSKSNASESADKGKSQLNPIQIPSISLPKGGGAIQGIGEKFQVNPVTGTGSFSVPIAISPGRGGFTPALSLSYDSGGGNSAYGLGWSIGVPSISRKTQQGLPQYQDKVEGDTFLLSGAEDLVPYFENQNGEWLRRERREGDYQILSYRPRIEGLFARIERWLNTSNGMAHWRTVSKENITTLYGVSEGARIADPNDPRKIFQWLIEQSFDDKGNRIDYTYKREDAVNVPRAVFEKNRKHYSQLYLKQVQYGNTVPFLPLSSNFNEQSWRSDNRWLFELILDYGEHILGEQIAEGEIPSYTPQKEWLCRPDIFSSFRSGFDIRTYRLCRSILMFHHFEAPTLVKSTNLSFAFSPIASQISSITHAGYNGDTPPAYLPPLEFRYSQARINEQIQQIDQQSLENLPIGLDNGQYTFIDLKGEGLSGVLMQYPEAWYYKSNLGNGRFGPKQVVHSTPSPAKLGNSAYQLSDLDGNGAMNLVLNSPALSGFYEWNEEEYWEDFIAFRDNPNINWQDPNLRMIDLDGDGHADILITENDFFTWYASKEREGFGDSRKLAAFFDEDAGPKLIFSDGTQTIFTADMCGQGLTDLVRVRNGEVAYWANLGYGRFSPKITMANAPHFDAPDAFDPGRIRLVDIDGTGTNDLVYLGADAIRIWHNQSGNGFSAAQELRQFPRTNQLSNVAVVDLLGSGTACIVWSSPLPLDGYAPLRYIDLMAEGKPYLLLEVDNNLGAVSRMQYSSSSKFYLEDQRAGRPWITKLPFPVQVLERVEVYDAISQNRFVSRYAYHHGYFDGVEREFRGFGMVEQWDTEDFASFQENTPFSPPLSNWSETSDLPPVYTKTWFHNGYYHKSKKITSQYQCEYFAGDALAWDLQEAQISGALSAEERRQAARALKGSALRQEIYALDGSAQAQFPYSVTETGYQVNTLQPQLDNEYAVYYTYPAETLSYHYERNPADPRIGQQITFEVDAYGNATKMVNIGYPRRSPLLPEQGVLYATYSEHGFLNQDAAADFYRIGVAFAQSSYEMQGLAQEGSTPINKAQIQAYLDTATRVPFHATPNGNQLRLLGAEVLQFYNDSLSAALPVGEGAALILPYASYRAVFSAELLEGVFGGRATLTEAQIQEAGYVPSSTIPFALPLELPAVADLWWIPSGRMEFDAAHFYLPLVSIDPFGQSTHFVYDEPYWLFLTQTSTILYDAVELRTQAQYDYRVLQAWQMTNPNEGISELAFDTLGMVVATAIRGRAGEGDQLPIGLTLDLSNSQLDELYAHNGRLEALARPLLGSGTTRLIYDLHRYRRSKTEAQPQPNFVYSISREIHLSEPGGSDTPLQHAFLYSDGFGREILTKIPAEAGTAYRVDDAGNLETLSDVNPRWVGTGMVINNNKGLPVKQYEPYFSSTHRYESDNALRQWGVSPILHYDPLGRNIRTILPDGTLTRVEFSPWIQISYDQNDTVSESSWLTRMSASANTAEQRAAKQALVHANTPSEAHLDTLGRTILGLAHNRYADAANNNPGLIIETFIPSRTILDIEGNPQEIWDGRRCEGLSKTQALLHRGNRVMQYRYAMGGLQLYQDSMDAGARWVFPDIAGNPFLSFDGREQNFRFTYDALRRPLATYLQVAGAGEILVQAALYGEQHPEALERQLRGQVFQFYDQSGRLTSVEYDFKGNLRRSERQLAAWSESTRNWAALEPFLATPLDLGNLDTSTATLLENESFVTAAEVNALNRPRRSLSPDGSVFYPLYNEAGLLDALKVNLRGASSVADESPEAIRNNNQLNTYVVNIDYDAKGQRERIQYGNGVSTRYNYDPQTFRLTRLRSTRASDNAVLQDLQYVYDPVGNITDLRDDAQATLFFRNQMVEPHSQYQYDALYQLIEATGRELAGQVNDAPRTHTDVVPVTPASPNDATAVRRYTQRYGYDAAGNINIMRHLDLDERWHRIYSYEAHNNRLLRTDDHPNFSYTYDAHGSMLAMPHLSALRWDYSDHLQAVDLGGGGNAYYTYDAQRQRVRKVIERQGNLRIERIYLGNYELYREYRANGLRTQQETLHIMDEQSRIAMVETTTIENGNALNQIAPLTRYQLANHLGSAFVELSENAELISYEEYHPYGTSAFRAGRSEAEASLKRYRYTGMERDEETGLSYHSARYYVTWLGRWAKPDSLKKMNGLFSYVYTNNNPINRKDINGYDWIKDKLLDTGTFLFDKIKVDDFAAGLGDRFSFGLTKKAREKLDIQGGVDTSSQAYQAGETTANAVELSTGVGGLVKSAVKHGVRATAAMVLKDELKDEVVTSGLDVLDTSGTASAAYNLGGSLSPLASSTKKKESQVDSNKNELSQKNPNDNSSLTTKTEKPKSTVNGNVRDTRHVRGLLGELEAAFALGKQGHVMVGMKFPSIDDLNKPGFDLVTFKDGRVYFIDNKALTRDGLVKSVTALNENFNKNLEKYKSDLRSLLSSNDLDQEARDLFTNVLGAIEAGNYTKAVTNKNLTSQDNVLTGVINALNEKGIEFINLYNQ